MQYLRQGDAERRIMFIYWLVTQLEDNPIILNYILSMLELLLNKLKNNLMDMKNV